MSVNIPDFNNLPFSGIQMPEKHSIYDECDGSSTYLVAWPPFFFQEYPIPNGSFRLGDEVVEPTSFHKGKGFKVLVDQKWWPVEDVTFLEGGMTVTYKSHTLLQRTFMFSAMKWDLSYQ